METLRSFLPVGHRLLGWSGLILAASAGLFWNSEARAGLLGAAAAMLGARYLVSRLLQQKSFSVLSRVFFLYIPALLAGYTLRPSYPLPPQEIPSYLSENLLTIIKARAREYVIRYRDIETEARGVFSEDNLNSAYAEGNPGWNSLENATPVKPLAAASHLPVVLLRTEANLDSAVTDSLLKVSLSALTLFPIEVITQAARQNSLQEAAFSQSGLTAHQVELGQLKNADFIYTVSITRAKLSPGFRVEVTFQEAYSGTVRRQLRGYAQDEKELAALLTLGPGAIIKR
jgi:hypothetical protein